MYVVHYSCHSGVGGWFHVRAVGTCSFVHRLISEVGWTDSKKERKDGRLIPSALMLIESVPYGDGRCGYVLFFFLVAFCGPHSSWWAWSMESHLRVLLEFHKRRLKCGMVTGSSVGLRTIKTTCDRREHLFQIYKVQRLTWLNGICGLSKG